MFLPGIQSLFPGYLDLEIEVFLFDIFEVEDWNQQAGSFCCHDQIIYYRNGYSNKNQWSDDFKSVSFNRIFV